MARGRGADGEEEVLTGSKDPNPMSKPLVLWSLRAEGHGCVGPAVEGTVPSARIQSGAAGDGAPERSKWGPRRKVPCGYTSGAEQTGRAGLPVS